MKSERYSVLAILLHWTIAAAIVLQIVLAGRMEGPPTPESFAVTQLHKSVGITVLFLSLARLAWRLINPPPPMPATLASWERTLATATHIAFYAVMLGMPITGWIMVSSSQIVLPTLLYGEVPWPMIPGLADLAPGARKIWHTVGERAHGTIIKGAYVLIALHVAGALKHQLFSRDEPVLARMAPGAKPGRWWEPRLIVIALAALGVIAFGRWVQPPRPSLGPPPAAAAPAAEPVEAQAPVAAPTAVATPSGPRHWIVAKGSTLGFATTWSGSAIQGRFDRWTADILFAPDALERSKVTVSIDMGSAKTGDAQRDQTLPSGDWFDAAAHPKAVFTAARFEARGGDRYVAHGTLSLKGVSRPLDLPFRLTIAGDTAQAKGSASVDRIAHGVGQGDFAGTDQIPGRVTVSLDLRATAVP